MTKFFTCFLLLLFTAFAVKAQTQPQPGSFKVRNDSHAFKETQPYGKIDLADLEMASCDFENDANAEVLFDKCSVTTESEMRADINGRPIKAEYLMGERHTRIKIFNEFGKNEANIRIQYISFSDAVVIDNLKAESINLENGKMVFTPIDKKGIYTEKVDKIRSALVFAIPNVKPGTVIEYKYTVAFRTFPTWYFQTGIPTRYSEIDIDLPITAQFRSIPHVSQPFVKNVGASADYVQVKAMANIHSLPYEQYMGARNDNLERIEYLGMNTIANSWPKIGDLLLSFSEFSDELDRTVTGGSEIIKQAKNLKTDDDKIAFIFDTVKNNMKWNDINSFFVSDGTVRAWDKKSGNSAEINLILYQLLKRAGIKAHPMVVSTKNNGKINPANPDPFSFNNTVIYVPVDSTKYYILDATNKYNLYNTVPADELNSFGLSIDEQQKESKIIFIENKDPVMQAVFLNAEINPGGKMNGTAEITSYSYNKINATRKYKTDGEQKYIDSLSADNKNLKVSSFKMENTAVDSLPLTQKINFSADLAGSDENYIYFNTNLFASMGDNPFKNEDRYSDIDFGYRDNYSVSGVYKLPSGYKIEALPKSITIVMPDKSLIFKRTVAEDNGTIVVRYMLNHLKTIYFREDYQDLRGFYKKMYELIDEQVVLKKA